MEDAGGGALVAGRPTASRTPPSGLPLEIGLGQAMDIGGSARTTEQTRAATSTEAVTATLVNAKPLPIVLEYRQPPQGADFQVLRASQTPTAKAGDQIWTIRRQPGERAHLRYTVRFHD